MTQALLNKSFWVSLILTAVIIIGPGVWAQDPEPANELSDWIYQAMTLLDQEGLLENYPVAWVKAGNQLARFEIAYYLKQFIVNQSDPKLRKTELSSPATQALQKLIGEFRNELADLGIKTTDIYGISPNLISAEGQDDGYRDLDLIISKAKFSTTIPYYYLGQYYNAIHSRSFIFLPDDYVNPLQLGLLEGVNGKINLVYHPKQPKNPSFVVIKGKLPMDQKQPPVEGYYLFPVENFDSGVMIGINNLVMTLLEELNQMQQIENLWRFEGSPPLEGYEQLENDLQSKDLLGSLNQGLKIGGMLIYTDNPATHNEFDLNSFGLPLNYQPNYSMPGAVDLDSIDSKYLQSLQINIQGSLTLSSQTALFGQLDFLFRENNDGLPSILPSDTKATAGLQYNLNDYWTLLTYQSFVNSQFETGLLSTTAVGVEYNDWITLWLAYQLLDFDAALVTGAVEMHY